MRLEKSPNRQWGSPAQFFAAAAEAMRHILMDNARRKRRLKRGGQFKRVELDTLELAAPLPDEDLLALDEALGQLEQVDATAAQLVKLRFFAGLTQAEAATQLGLSNATADRTWHFARLWLFSRIRPPDQAVSPAKSVGQTANEPCPKRGTTAAAPSGSKNISEKLK